jgi:tetratricopeptide (TPR) repeat protein
MPLAEQAAERALAIEQDNAEALTSRACIRAMYDWEWSSAERDFTTSIMHNPNYATAHQWYAMHCLAPQGRFVDAHNALRRARELDPLSPVIHASRGVMYYYERKYERALAEYDRVFEIDPDFGMAHYFAGQTYERTARYDEAAAAFERAMAHAGPTPETIAALGHVHAVAGHRSAADERLAALMALSQQRYVSPVLIALIYTGLGDSTNAITWLQKGVGARAIEMAWLGVRPVFDSLRPHPAFQSILEEVRLAPDPVTGGP